MQKLYYFNPDSDLALANNDPNFMSPKAIRSLTQDLALLPIWYADQGSSILVNNRVDKAYFEELIKQLNIEVSLLTLHDLSVGQLDFKLEPWGWNQAVRRQFERYGFTDFNLKSIAQIDRIRELSSRRWVSSVLMKLSDNLQVCGQSEVLSSLDDLSATAQNLERFLLKAPFSGSGRGLKWCRHGLDQASIRWFKNTLKQQELVIAEPIYQRVEDFAMEFEIFDSSKIEFIGYSYFKTTDNGVYLGNNLISDVDFENYLEAHYFSSGFLESIRKQLQDALLEIYGADYRGVLGVDMMVCLLPNNSYSLHPCVEVNLRMNMGVVARRFYERFIKAGKQGSYAVDFFKHGGEAWALHLEREKKYPLIIKEGKIKSGYLSLSAITTESLCQAWVIVE